MIHIFIGTKAQFIKMVPVMVELEKRGVGHRYIDSGQHAELTKGLRRVFGIGEPDLLLGTGGNVSTILGALRWYFGHLWRAMVSGRWLREEVFPGGGICLVHGDTLSTLLGVQLARRAGLSVGHVEAGLRSGRYLDPFPEEIIRLLCMRRSDLLFAPSPEAVSNLKTLRVRGTIVELPGNTGRDAVRLAGQMGDPGRLPSGPFALATCHRLETITVRSRLKAVVDLLNRVAEDLDVLFVVHEPTARALRRFGLEDRLAARIRRAGMQEYPTFVALLAAAQFVLTDGGSIQEECASLRKPCLVLRRRTERPDGIGQNAVLWGFDAATAERFLTTLSQKERSVPPEATASPSAEIADALHRLGFGTNKERASRR